MKEDHETSEMLKMCFIACNQKYIVKCNIPVEIVHFSNIKTISMLFLCDVLFDCI